MDPKIILAGLEELAARLGIHVRYERLGDDDNEVRSGRCRLKGEDILLVERGLDPPARVEVLRRALAREDLGGVYIKPNLRRLLED